MLKLSKRRVRSEQTELVVSRERAEQAEAQLAKEIQFYESRWLEERAARLEAEAQVRPTRAWLRLAIAESRIEKVRVALAKEDCCCALLRAQGAEQRWCLACRIEALLE